jgi:hypothetical protein
MRRIVHGPVAVVRDFAARVDVVKGCPITGTNAGTGQLAPEAQKTITAGQVFIHPTDPTRAAYVVRVGRNRAAALAVIQAIRDKPIASRTAAERAILQELSVEEDWSAVWESLSTP